MFQDLIEFEVELNPIPFEDGLGKDVTVNWRLFDGFNINRTFWTDSNGLEMQERRIKDVPMHKKIVDDKTEVNQYTIASNYMPVDSAIAVRDQQQGRNVQVTVMNERA